MHIDKNSDSDLMLAADKGDLKAVSSILELSSLEDINYSNDYGNTALWLAANHNHKAIVDLLLKAGADPTIANCKAELPAMAAYKQDLNDVVVLLPELSQAEKDVAKPVQIIEVAPEPVLEQVAPEPVLEPVVEPEVII